MTQLLLLLSGDGVLKFDWSCQPYGNEDCALG